jgi:hypothetical protein
MSDPPDLAALPAALLAAAAGTADLAREQAGAGVDVIVAYHSSPLRHRGLPSVTGPLPLGQCQRHHRCGTAARGNHRLGVPARWPDGGHLMIAEDRGWPAGVLAGWSLLEHSARR